MVCCVAVLDRAYGRPREVPAEDGPEDQFARMTRAERLAYVEALAPMRKYLHELDEDQAEAEAASTTIDRAVD